MLPDQENLKKKNYAFLILLLYTCVKNVRPAVKWKHMWQYQKVFNAVFSISH